MPSDDTLVSAVAQTALPITGAPSDLDPLLELVSDARCVLIGEETHGTHEFYRQRALLTRRLISEQGFTAVAVEADWPDAYRVNRYVRGLGGDADAEEALGDFERFPAWMWRNADVLDFVGWLRALNDDRPAHARVGFYGLDLYSLRASVEAVVAYLEHADPEGARRARARYACFESYGQSPQSYGHAATLGLSPGCEQEAVSQLIELQQRRAALLQRDGHAGEDEYFQAEQNARIVSNAEHYYRTMFQSHVSSWNVRDTHMADTLDSLLQHLGHRFERPKVVVWAHNSHVGDARATEMGEAGEVSIGQLARERHTRTALIGFSTYAGSVTAAKTWGAAAERMRVREALPGSYGQLFHRTGLSSFILPLRDLGEAAGALREPRLQRAIGVVYLPESERRSHYYHARLSLELDAVVHIDATRAIEPLERTTGWDLGEVPETFPTGI